MLFYFVLNYVIYLLKFFFFFLFSYLQLNLLKISGLDFYLIKSYKLVRVYIICDIFLYLKYVCTYIYMYVFYYFYYFFVFFLKKIFFFNESSLYSVVECWEVLNYYVIFPILTLCTDFIDMYVNGFSVKEKFVHTNMFRFSSFTLIAPYDSFSIIKFKTYGYSIIDLFLKGLYINNDVNLYFFYKRNKMSLSISSLEYVGLYLVSVFYACFFLVSLLSFLTLLFKFFNKAIKSDKTMLLLPSGFYLWNKLNKFNFDKFTGTELE